MRIVSWNINGKVVNLRKMLNAIGAHVCVLQEPTATLSVDGGTGRFKDTSPITWTGQHVAGSCAQDNYYYAYSQSTTCSYHLVESEPRGPGTLSGRNYLVLKVKDVRSSVRLATFHAPYLVSQENHEYANVTAVEYLQALMGSNLTFQRPPKLGDTRAPRTKQIDLILADTNIYDYTDCRVAWSCVLNSQTGKGKSGGSLDRVFTRPGAFTNFRCGRIYIEGQAQGLLSMDRRAGNVLDIQLPEEPAYQDWMKSDHLAIYFDTNATFDALPVIAQGSGKKASRDTGDLLELDDTGKPKKQKP